jgi:hypothetical protein
LSGIYSFQANIYQYIKEIHIKFNTLFLYG